MPALARPAARMATILTMLRDAPQQTLRSEQIWREIDDYDHGGDSGRRSYRRDISTLRQRGLIESDLTIPEIGATDRNAVRLLFIGKPEGFVLSSGEHRALRAARKLHPRPLPPVLEGARGGESALGLAMNAVRVLEEEADRIDLPDLAIELACTPEAVFQALELLVSMEFHYKTPHRHLELDCDDDAWTDEQQNPPAHLYYASVLPSMRHPEAPLRGRGLDVLGRFHYNAAECADRLDLIEQALGATLTDEEREALLSARRKISGWADHLARAEQERVTRAS
jgi:hypothetical protein